MDVEFDPAKNEANVARHGLSLDFGRHVFQDADHVVLSSIRPIDGEDRYKVIGMVKGKLYNRGSRSSREYNAVHFGQEEQ